MSYFSRLFSKKPEPTISKPEAGFITGEVRKAKADHIRAVRALVAETRKHEVEAVAARDVIAKVVERVTHGELSHDASCKE